MRAVGIFLVFIGIFGTISGGAQAPAGTDPATAAGMAMGPLICIGLGSFLAWKGRSKA